MLHWDEASRRHLEESARDEFKKRCRIYLYVRKIRSAVEPRVMTESFSDLKTAMMEDKSLTGLGWKAVKEHAESLQSATHTP